MPLIVLTADRPPELREVGAGPGDRPDGALRRAPPSGSWRWARTSPGRETAIHHRALACRAWWTAAGGRPGPGAPQLPAARAARPRARAARRRRLGGPPRRPALDRAARARQRAARGRRARSSPRAWPPRRAARSSAAPAPEAVAEPAARLAAQCGWPLLAEPTSGRALRRPRPLARGGPLRRAAARGALRRGPAPRAGAARGRHAHLQAAARLAGRARRRCVIDPHAAWHEPTRRAELVLACAAAPALDALAHAVEMRSAQPDPAWLASLARGRRAGAAGAGRGARRLRGRSCSPALEPELPDDALVWVSSSMPIRDVEALLPAVAQAAALPGQPRRQRDRRRGVVGAGRGAGERPAHLAADRRAGAAARRRRPAGGAPRRRRADDRLPRQRRRRDLRLPAGGRARRGRGLRAATSPRRRAWTSRRCFPRCASSARTGARTSGCTARRCSAWLSSWCSRPGRSCGGSARRPCRRSARPAGWPGRSRPARSRHPP